MDGLCVQEKVQAYSRLAQKADAEADRSLGRGYDPEDPRTGDGMSQEGELALSRDIESLMTQVTTKLLPYIASA